MTGRSEAAGGGSKRGCQVCGASLLDDEAPGPGYEQARRAASDTPLDSTDPAVLEELALEGRLEVVDERADGVPGGSKPAEPSSRAAAADRADSRSDPAGLGQDTGSEQDQGAAAAAGSSCAPDGQNMYSVSETPDARLDRSLLRQTDAEWFAGTPDLQWEAPGTDAVLLGASMTLLAMLSVATRTCR